MSEEEKKDIYTEAQETIEEIEHKLGNITWSLYIKGYTEKQIDKKINLIDDVIWKRLQDNEYKRMDARSKIYYDIDGLTKVKVTFKTDIQELKNKTGVMYAVVNKTHTYNYQRDEKIKRDGKPGRFYFTQSADEQADVSFGVCNLREHKVTSYTFNSVKKASDGTYVDFLCVHDLENEKMYLSFDGFRDVEVDFSPQPEENSDDLIYIEFSEGKYIPVSLSLDDGSYESLAVSVITQAHYESIDKLREE